MSSRVEHSDFSQRLQLPENVSDPLESGVDDFHLMISNMSDEKLATPNGRSFMNYFEKNVLPHCNHMNKNFRDMQSNVQKILKKVNKEIEELTKDLNDLKSQKKTTENKMQELEGDLEEFKIKHSEATQQHSVAMSDLSGTRTLQEYLEDKREKAKGQRNRSTVAFGLTILIPGVNVVMYMIKKAMQEKLDRCNRNLDIALEKIKSCKNDMEALEKTIQKLNDDIERNREAYHQLDKDIQENNTRRSSLLQNQKNFEKIQDQLRKICRAIDDISSASGCVLQQSKGCYSIEPLILPAETLVDRLQNLVYDHHLSSSRKLHESLRDIESQIVSIKDKLNADALPTPNFCVKFLCCFKKR